MSDWLVFLYSNSNSFSFPYSNDYYYYTLFSKWILYYNIILSFLVEKIRNFLPCQQFPRCLWTSRLVFMAECGASCELTY